MKELDMYYSSLDEPMQSCMTALSRIILDVDPEIIPEWKYRTPFFYFRGRMMAYIWVHKKTNRPYLGMVEGKLLNYENLDFEKTKRIKVFYLNVEEDLPVSDIQKIILLGVNLYKSGKVKTK